MMRSQSLSLLGLACLLAVVACGGQQDEAEPSAEKPAMEETVAAEPAAEAEPAAVAEAVPTEEENAEPAAESPDQEGEPPAAGGVAKPPATVAPAPGVEQAEMKHWMLIEFAESVEPEDLRWLEENGFRVDTVMSAKLVRGWLAEMAGGEVIAKDPRIVKIHPQMR